MTASSGDPADVLLLSVGGREPSAIVRSAVFTDDRDVERTTDVGRARRAVDGAGPACVVVDGPPAAAVDALDAVADRAGATTVLAAVGGADGDESDRVLDAGADDILPVDAGGTTERVAANRVAEAIGRRRAEQRATLAYESHDALLAEASVPVYLVDVDAVVVHATEGAAGYLGYDDPSELVGTDIHRHVAPADRERAADRLERVFDRTASVPEAELELSTVDGDRRYAAVSTTPAHYDGDAVAQVVARDVTDRHDPVRAMTRRESVLPTALEVLDDVLFVVDDDGDLRVWNDALCETIGYDDDEVAAMEPEDFFPDDVADEAVDALRAVFESGSGTLEAPLLSRDGERVPCEFRSRAIENDDGDAVGVVGLGRDVRERKRRERALRTLNTVATELEGCETPAEAAQRTVDAATEVLDMEFCDVSLVDDDGTHLEVAAATDALDEDATTRMAVDEGVAGLTYRTGSSYLVDDLEEFEEAQPQGEFHSLLSVPVGDDGVFQAVAEARDAFDETDLELVELLAGHCATALDRIEREATLRERTDSLRDQNERLEEFASVVSHDLRNPLTLLQGELSVAESDGDPESFDRAFDAIDRMDRLIGDLLSLARAGEGVAETERVSLETTSVQCWSTISETNATLDLADPPTVDADPTRFRQLLENLFRNAVEHAAGDGPGDDVTVTVGGLDDGGGFYVADDGPGIPESEREDVFDSGYTTAEDGNGFGLRIVEDVAGAHDWGVTVTESTEGGARFEIRT